MVPALVQMIDGQAQPGRWARVNRSLWPQNSAWPFLSIPGKNGTTSTEVCRGFRAVGVRGIAAASRRKNHELWYHVPCARYTCWNRR